MSMIRRCCWNATLSLIVFLIAGSAWAAGTVTPEVDTALGIASLRNEKGVTGAGVTIGVSGFGVDDNVRWKLVTSGDLPAGDIELVNGSDGDGYSTLMELQIIHDIAPEARLVFGCNYNGDRDIPDLVAAGADIILVDDNVPYVSVFEDEPGTLPARDAALAGKLVIAPAGNFGVSHYRGYFTDAGDGNHDFGNGTRYVLVQMPADCYTEVSLNWAETWGQGSYYDYRLRTYTANGNLMHEVPIDGYYPAAGLIYDKQPSDWVFGVGAWKAGDAPALSFDLFISCDYTEDRQATMDAAYRVDRGSIAGIAALSEVLTVGALDQDTPGHKALYAPQSYSSHGPSEILIPNLQVRSKPDIAAPDCQSVNDPLTASYARKPCGTRYASAVVAGIAALLREAYPNEDGAALKMRLTRSAIDVGDPGFDYVTGWGQVDPWAAYNYVPVPAIGGWSIILLVLSSSLLLVLANHRPYRECKGKTI